MSSPLAFFPATPKWTIFSETQALINTTATYTLKAELADWPTSVAGNAAATTAMSDGEITYQDPCLAPFSITATPTSVDIGDHEYDNSVLTHDNNPMTVEPNICTVSYSCAQQSGPSVLSCTEAGITTFNAANGDFTFTASTAEFSTYVPGTYVFRITGTTGIVPEGEISAFVDVTFELIDICP